jgi:hypothetical protein
MKAQCAERNELLEKMWSVIRSRVLVDDPRQDCRRETVTAGYIRGNESSFYTRA